MCFVHVLSSVVNQTGKTNVVEGELTGNDVVGTAKEDAAGELLKMPAGKMVRA